MQIAKLSKNLFFILTFTLWSYASSKEPIFVIQHPTVIACFPVTKAELSHDADMNESLADFQYYTARVRKPLKDAGIDFKEIYISSFRIQNGSSSTVFRPSKSDVGYYFVTVGKAPYVIHGVMTDADLLESANKYFGVVTK